MGKVHHAHPTVWQAYHRPQLNVGDQQSNLQSVGLLLPKPT